MHAMDASIFCQTGRHGMLCCLSHAAWPPAWPRRSPIGQFRLPPPAGKPLNQLRYAIFSCSNWQVPSGGCRVADCAGCAKNDRLHH